MLRRHALRAALGLLALAASLTGTQVVAAPAVAAPAARTVYYDASRAGEFTTNFTQAAQIWNSRVSNVRLVAGTPATVTIQVDNGWPARTSPARLRPDLHGLAGGGPGVRPDPDRDPRTRAHSRAAGPQDRTLLRSDVRQQRPGLLPERVPERGGGGPGGLVVRRCPRTRVRPRFGADRRRHVRLDQRLTPTRPTTGRGDRR